jgi:hypothetical protein
MRAAARVAAFLLLVIGGGVAAAATMPVPVEVQFPLFVKIWKLDRTFPANADVTIAVIYQKTHGASVIVKAQVEEWIAASGQRMHCVSVAVDDPAEFNALYAVHADVFYIAPLRGVDIATVAGIARARHIRTTTGVPLYVDAGLSVAIDVRNDRPLIVINVAAARAEGSSFPAQLLQLARLVDAAH